MLLEEPIDLTTPAKAVLERLAKKADRKNGVIKLAELELNQSQQHALDELRDQRLVEYEDGVWRLLISRADVSQLVRPAAGYVAQLPATSSKPETSRGLGSSERLRRTLADNPADCQEAISRVSEDAAEWFGGTDESTPVRPRKRAADDLDSIPVSSWNSKHLAAHFAREVRDQAVLQRVRLGPAAFNFGALVGHFTRWRRDDGLSNEEVVEMINLFARNLTRYIRKGTPAWKMFLARRQRLFQDARRIAGEKRKETASEGGWFDWEEDDTNWSWN